LGYFAVLNKGDDISGELGDEGLRHYPPGNTVDVGVVGVVGFMVDSKALLDSMSFSGAPCRAQKCETWSPP